MSYRHKHIKKKILKLKPKKPFYKKRHFWIFFLILAVFFAGIYFLLFFDKIQVKTVIISGNKGVKTAEIKNAVLDTVNKNITRSIFLANCKNIDKELLSNFPKIKTAETVKIFPATLSVALTERKPAAVFCQPGGGMPPEDCYFIDESGVIFEALQSLPENMTVIRKTANNNEVLAGDDVINKNIMDAISKTERALKDNFQIDLKEAMLSTPTRLDFTTSEKWKIYFNLESNVDMQLTEMNSVLKDEITADARKNLQYIDLRFKDRAFYK